MKPRVPIFTLILASAASFLVGGCNSFDARARQMAGVYQQLPASDQQRLKSGAINIGDTPEMVYIALGNPEERRDVLTADGQQTTWSYKSYWQQYEGTALYGYRRVIVPSRTGRGYAVFYEPVGQDIYRTYVDDMIRVTFSRGVVSQVEQQRR